MTVFEYLSVLMSVIFGLGVTHLLAGVSKIIHHRDTMRIYWVHLVWAFNLLVYILAIWWGMFWWSTAQEWYFFQYLFIVLYAILMFLAAGMLFPWSLENDFDGERHFMYNRRWFFGIHALCWLVDIPETFSKADGGLRDAPSFYVAYVGLMLSISVAGAV